MIVVLGLTGWPIYTRVVRAETLKFREREFVLAARALGLGTMRILRLHGLPNLVNTISVMASLEVARMIILESFLSFLGLGIQPPTPSWGAMLGEGRVYMLTHWWLAAFPGAAIFVTTLGINLFGDGLRGGPALPEQPLEHEVHGQQVRQQVALDGEAAALGQELPEPVGCDARREPRVGLGAPRPDAEVRVAALVARARAEEPPEGRAHGPPRPRGAPPARPARPGRAPASRPRTATPPGAAPSCGSPGSGRAPARSPCC